MKTGDNAKHKIMHIAVGVLFSTLAISIWSAEAAEDNRELVKLPPRMQAHMLANMRHHLRALDEMLSALAEGNIDWTTDIAEKRLGMSSLSSHGAAHLAQFMPQNMREIGTQMHQAASRFVITARNAELEPGLESQHRVYSALHAITENCNACHHAYRIR